MNLRVMGIENEENGSGRGRDGLHLESKGL